MDRSRTKLVDTTEPAFGHITRVLQGEHLRAGLRSAKLEQDRHPSVVYYMRVGNRRSIVIIPNPAAIPVVPVYLGRGGRRYLDRHSLAAMTDRSVHTIRVRCPIAFHHQGKAMYDMELCEDLLSRVATRQRVLAA